MYHHKNITSLYNFSAESYTEFMEENFKVSSKSVDSGRWYAQYTHTHRAHDQLANGYSSTS